jgi:hypothetical protein
MPRLEFFLYDILGSVDCRARKKILAAIVATRGLPFLPVIIPKVGEVGFPSGLSNTMTMPKSARQSLAPHSLHCPRGVDVD